MNDPRVLIAEELTLEQAVPSRLRWIALLVPVGLALFILAVWLLTDDIGARGTSLIFGSTLVVFVPCYACLTWWIFRRDVPRRITITNDGVLHVAWRRYRLDVNLQTVHWFQGDTRLDMIGYALRKKPAIVLYLENDRMLAVGYSESLRQQWKEVLETSQATRIRDLSSWQRRGWVSAWFVLGPLIGGVVGYFVGRLLEWTTSIDPLATPNLFLGATTGFCLLAAVYVTRHMPSSSPDRLPALAFGMLVLVGVHVTFGLIVLGHSIFIGIGLTVANLAVTLLGVWLISNMWDIHYQEQSR